MIASPGINLARRVKGKGMIKASRDSSKYSAIEGVSNTTYEYRSIAEIDGDIRVGSIVVIAELTVLIISPSVKLTRRRESKRVAHTGSDGCECKSVERVESAAKVWGATKIDGNERVGGGIIAKLTVFVVSPNKKLTGRGNGEGMSVIIIIMSAGSGDSFK